LQKRILLSSGFILLRGDGFPQDPNPHHKISPVARLLIPDRLAFKPHLPSPMFGQIFPSGISLFDQSNLGSGTV
jgi:hypothetical protein